MGYQENYLPSEQKKLGHNVDIITSDSIPNYQGYAINIERVFNNEDLQKKENFDNNVKIYRLKSLFHLQYSGQLLIIGLKKKLIDLKPDVVHCHSPFSLLTIQVVIYSKKMGYKVFIDDHSHDDNFIVNNFLKKIYVALIKFFYQVYENRVNLWLPVSYSSYSIIKNLFSIPENKIKLLPLGVNSTLFFPSSIYRQKIRQELHINEDEILLISAGKLEKYKEIEIIILAMRETIKKHEKLKLLLIGDGPKEYVEYLFDLIKRNGLSRNIIKKPFLKNSELSHYYNGADIGIWPGAHSITSIESIATGLPIIVPNTLIHQILIKNKSVFTFERKNVKSLVTVLELLISSKKNRESVTKNALNLVNNQLSWEKIAEKSLGLYRKY